jgi:cholesterol oxidase
MDLCYDAIVIGTGFGGAVAACRLAQAGQRIAILERGRRYPTSDPTKKFPRDLSLTSRGFLYDKDQGLWDLKPINEVLVVQGAGYGGGSLIYASAHIRADADVFAEGWPAGFSRAALDPYYDLAAYMLDIKPITESPGGLPPKALLMKKIARQLGREAQLFHPNLAVDLGEPGVPRRNKFGVEQRGCNHCGECSIGCNVGAKSSLDMNYLAVAEARGAEVRTQCEVFSIEPTAAGYRVLYRDHRQEGATVSIEAKRVFLCAGAVNSTELLLRCRDEHRTLPRVNERLGAGYSSNGDYLSFAFDTAEPAEPSRGPTITTALVVDQRDGGDRSWFMIEEGGYPKELAWIVKLLGARAGSLGGTGDLLRDDVARRVREASRQAGGGAGEGGANTLFMLVMGRDRADGRIELTPAGKLRVRWEVRSNMSLYSAEERVCADMARAAGGRLVESPLWRALNQPICPHNLGGCTMSDDPARGVTDPTGEVYGHPGLFVIDGAILPAATGVNPSSTIAAVAERNMEQIIRRIAGDPGWQAPERAAARPVHEPMSRVVIPLGGTAQPKTPAIGVRFQETLRGFARKGHAPIDDYKGAEAAGQRRGSEMEASLTITIPNVDRFVADKARAALADGHVRIDGITDPDGAPVVGGVFNLFACAEGPRARRMLYALPFTGEDGKPYLLDGFKDIVHDEPFDLWSDNTTLFAVVREGSSRSGRVVATGILRIQLADFLHQLTTLAAFGTDDPTRQAAALARFGALFLGELWDVYAWSGGRTLADTG